MPLRPLVRVLATLSAAALAVLGGVAVSGAPAAAAASLDATVCYSTSQAGPYASYANQAATIWNNATNNVNMSRCGSNIMIYYTSGGGSYAVRYSLGNGYIVIDSQQAAQYSPLRIVAHEMGHLLGLPDNYNGSCAILMSGGSAGTSCTNPYPSAAEAARVDQNFGGYAISGGAGTTVFQDSWPALSGAAR
ncbi:snapalysin family zinc-dependent metalloprotease [Plantactinospora sp. KBS50]|uniref:snapalysin family zinc-dependent metalloprotease n=1 Tax=Plantactinospora sp. KBS50 TaxID=2024580 RepID=UPI000BAAD12C|nr:snapalysin family zinc-dependent metalloprotease [Plantactinospora sp. KBS50]ASW55266.1 peptidase M7 [Plantactinospora sp. KBS50]